MRDSGEEEKVPAAPPIPVAPPIPGAPPVHGVQVDGKAKVVKVVRPDYKQLLTNVRLGVYNFKPIGQRFDALAEIRMQIKSINNFLNLIIPDPKDRAPKADVPRDVIGKFKMAQEHLKELCKFCGINEEILADRSDELKTQNALINFKPKAFYDKYTNLFQNITAFRKKFPQAAALPEQLGREQINQLYAGFEKLTSPAAAPKKHGEKKVNQAADANRHNFFMKQAERMAMAIDQDPTQAKEDVEAVANTIHRLTRFVQNFNDNDHKYDNEQFKQDQSDIELLLLGIENTTKAISEANNIREDYSTVLEINLAEEDEDTAQKIESIKGNFAKLAAVREQFEQALAAQKEFLNRCKATYNQMARISGIIPANTGVGAAASAAKFSGKDGGSSARASDREHTVREDATMAEHGSKPKKVRGILNEDEHITEEKKSIPMTIDDLEKKRAELDKEAQLSHGRAMQTAAEARRTEQQIASKTEELGGIGITANDKAARAQRTQATLKKGPNQMKAALAFARKVDIALVAFGQSIAGKDKVEIAEFQEKSKAAILKTIDDLIVILDVEGLNSIEHIMNMNDDKAAETILRQIQSFAQQVDTGAEGQRDTARAQAEEKETEEVSENKRKQVMRKVIEGLINIARADISLIGEVNKLHTSIDHTLKEIVDNEGKTQPGKGMKIAAGLGFLLKAAAYLVTAVAVGITACSVLEILGAPIATKVSGLGIPIDNLSGLIDAVSSMPLVGRTMSVKLKAAVETPYFVTLTDRIADLLVPRIAKGMTAAMTYGTAASLGGLAAYGVKKATDIVEGIAVAVGNKVFTSKKSAGKPEHIGNSAPENFALKLTEQVLNFCALMQEGQLRGPER